MAREKKKKKGDQQAHQGELDPETEERNRLKSLAYSNSILSDTPTKKGFNPLAPSKTVIKHHGKDILKKTQRKNRYLFSFPGLLAPISGGKIGELTDLGSQNPTLYLDFPQGRMKLFGTIVYPKNRYLSLQFSRGGKNVVCDDCFDTMIVFSDACWVGKKEENPDEARLQIPKELYEGTQCEVDFQGGAGASAMKNTDIKKVVVRSAEDETPPESPLDDMETESPERQNNLVDMTNSTPVRHSARTAGRKFNFAEVFSGDDSAESVSDMSGEENEEAAKSSKSCSLDQDCGIPETAVQVENFDINQQSTEPNTEQVPVSALSSSVTKEPTRGPLVQATISTLFKKVEGKNTTGTAKKGASSKVSSEKVEQKSSKSKNTKVKLQAVAEAAELRKEENKSRDGKGGARNDRKKQKAGLPEDEDDIEEFSSASEDANESDEDWCA